MFDIPPVVGNQHRPSAKDSISRLMVCGEGLYGLQCKEVLRPKCVSHFLRDRYFRANCIRCISLSIAPEISDVPVRWSGYWITIQHVGSCKKGSLLTIRPMISDKSDMGTSMVCNASKKELRKYHVFSTMPEVLRYIWHLPVGYYCQRTDL